MIKAESYFKANEGGSFLWNAKPRFGKTLSTYDLCMRLEARKILIVTNRPAIAESWYSDFMTFFGPQSGYSFVSTVSGIAEKPCVQPTADFKSTDSKVINFISLQDLKGSIYFGGNYEKLSHVRDTKWDIMVVDETHEGVDTFKTDVAFDQIRRRWTLHLSGTPFKALANNKFEDDAIFNWTYADEQQSKQEWEENSESINPYGKLPRLNLFTYRMSEMMEEKLYTGVEIDGEFRDYSFSLNDFFKVSNSRFVNDVAVDSFIDSLTTCDKYPFSTPELRDKLKHTIWMLESVESVKQLAKKLRIHPVFSEYGIVEAVGKEWDVAPDDDGSKVKGALEAVRKAIDKFDKTITLTVGQLTTGVTVPEWTAILMLSDMKSPSLYMQAAFRTQNPWEYMDGGSLYRKDNAYIFDFDPGRTLDIYETFANDLSNDTSSGRGTSDRRESNVRKLLNFLPVIGEDEGGQMVALDAEKVLSIPKEYRSKTVVRSGFMSDFLFQNITNVFHTSSEVWNILEKMESVDKDQELNKEMARAMQVDLDDDGNVVTPTTVIGTAIELFGPRIYESGVDILADPPSVHVTEESSEEKALKRMMEKFTEEVSDPMLDIAKETYGKKLEGASVTIKKSVEEAARMKFRKVISDVGIQERTAEADRQRELDMARGEDAKSAVEKKYALVQKDLEDRYEEAMSNAWKESVSETGERIIAGVETARKRNEKKQIEVRIRNHLRGFSRTIPSFIMAYGNEKTITLANIDSIVPEDVFLEVTGITVGEFRFLRDGGPYNDEETGEEKHFPGDLFNREVFNDSIKEFMKLRVKLKNYFDESSTEDIFFYIPPQKTNQIFTPRNVVIQMVDMLEEQNPGCFDDDKATFADLYMKSGMYITEIVRRLYRSKRMKELHPDGTERLEHIFAHQVYGLAPTEIIHRIVLSYVLGFDDEKRTIKHHLMKGDMLNMGTGETLNTNLRELFEI